MIGEAVRSAILSDAITEKVDNRVYVGNLDQSTDWPAIAYNLVDMQTLDTFKASATQRGTLEIGIGATDHDDIQEITTSLRSSLEKQEVLSEGYCLRFFGITAGPLEIASDNSWQFRPLQVRFFATELNS